VHKLTIPRRGQGQGGRNHTGRVVVRHRGGGHKRRIRTVDFARQNPGAHLVERIEHDPGRTAHIALLRNQETQEHTYILAAEGMRAGDVIQSYRSGLPEDFMKDSSGQIDRGLVAAQTAYRGNCLQLGMIPIGTPVYNISMDKESIGKMCRSAGTHGIIIAKGEDEVQKEMLKYIGDQGISKEAGGLEMSSLTPDQLRKYEKSANFVTVKLSSGELRLIDKEAVATIGIASNANYKYAQMGKAGRKRWLGFRPTVRGLAMNAVDHPHGGGRGKGKGNHDPVSPWGKPVCILCDNSSVSHFFAGCGLT
jgi:ribosomal protein L2